MSNILEIILSGDTRQLDAALSKTQKKLKDFGNSTKAIGKSMSIYVTAPITLAGGAAIKFASDFQESLNKVDVAFKNSSGEVKDFAKTTLESFGIAEGTALDMAALFGDMSTSMGLSTAEAANLSTSLVGLAGDLASFKNMNIEEVTTALNGVFTGETESLKRLGIVMTEVNLKQFAMEQGITKNIKLFTQAEKVQLRYNYVMSKTTNAQGDFARTSDGAANQMRIFQESLKEIGNEFGQILLPMFTKIITKVNGLLKQFRALNPATKKIILVVAGLAAAIGPLLITIGTLSSTVIPALIEGFKLSKDAAKLFKIELSLITGPVGIVVASIAGLLAVFTSLADKIAPNVSTIDQLKHAFLGLADGTSSARLAMAEFEAQRAKSAKIGAELSPGVAPTGPNLPGQGPAPAPAQFGLGLLAPNQINETKKAVEDLTPTVAKLKTEMKGLADLPIATPVAETFNEIAKSTEDLKMAFEVNFGQIAQTMAQSLGAAVVQGENLMGALAGTILSALGGLLQQMGAAAVAASQLATTFAIPIVGAAAGLAAIALGAILSGVGSKVQSGGFTAFANGGIVSGPVNALVGEYPGAKSNPEVIAPLNKLKNIIGEQGGGNMNVSGEFVVRGQDLVVALQRADKTRSRIK